MSERDSRALTQRLVALLVPGGAAVYLAGILTGYLPKENRLGTNEIGLLILAVFAAAGLFGKLSELKVGGATLLFDRVDRMESSVESIRAALEGIVTKFERMHLNKLVPPNNDIVRFGEDFMKEIRRLDAIDFLTPLDKQAGLNAIINAHGRPDEEFHLREYVQLTAQGSRYLRLIGDVPANKATRNA